MQYFKYAEFCLFVQIIHKNISRTQVKKQNQWTTNQKIRAELLIKNYPLLHKAYKHTLEFRNIYEQTSKEIAKEQMINWIEKTKLLKLNDFNTAENSLKYHLETILNFFIIRHTNANAESLILK